MELIDTSVVVDPGSVDIAEGAVSVGTLAELRFGIKRARGEHERRVRLARLGTAQRLFDPLPVDAPVSLAWGDLAGLVAQRGRKPRSRAFDLLIAATAQVHGLTLLTRDEDLLWLSDVLDVRRV